MVQAFQASRVTVMIKPVGALCNLDCHYCYYLPTKEVFGGHEHRMTTDTLEALFAGVLPRFDDQVTIAWQGGEPTLAGLDFFKKALAFQEKYKRPGQHVDHALQTNGTLLDDEWCQFLKQNNFLVGLSIDGPPHMHDRYRVDHASESSSDRVLAALRKLRNHGVEHNLLCVLNDRNVRSPDEVFHYLLNLGPRWLQFIPAIEWVTDEITGERSPAPFTPTGEQYGKFMSRVFDIWFERHRYAVSVRLFDAALNKLVHGNMPFCILDGACHNQLTIEHDGSVFGCDHFVSPRWRLGRIGDPDWVNALDFAGESRVQLTIGATAADDAMSGSEVTDGDPPSSAIDAGWFDRVDLERLEHFAARKDFVPGSCRSCQWFEFCHGGCPKHRQHGGDVAPEPSMLCAGYRMFYAHAMPRLEWLAGYLRQGISPPPIEAPVSKAARSIPDNQPTPRTPLRNGACPCGSGLKFKKCCGRANAQAIVRRLQ